MRKKAGDLIKRYAELACVLSLLLLFLAGCSVRRITDDTSPPYKMPDAAQPVAGIESENVESTESVPSRNFPEDGQDYVSITTRYGELRYQEQWAEFILTAQKTVGGNVVVEFTAEVGENIYPLFDVIIGEAEGLPMGEITDGSRIKRKVYFNVKEIEDISELTKDEQNLLLAMQEEINYISNNLK